MRYEEQFGENGIGQEIAGPKARQFADVSGPVRCELFCFASTPPRTRGAGFAPGLLKDHAFAMSNLAKVQLDDQREQLTAINGALGMHLRSAGLTADALDREAFFTTLWRLANPLCALMFDAPTYREDVSREPTASV